MKRLNSEQLEDVIPDDMITETEVLEIEVEPQFLMNVEKNYEPENSEAISGRDYNSNDSEDEEPPTKLAKFYVRTPKYVYIINETLFLRHFFNIYFVMS